MKPLNFAFIILLSIQVLYAREWTNKEGNSFEGTLVTVSDSEVKITRHTDGRPFTIPRDTLSKSDNEFIDQHIESLRIRKLRESIPATYREMLKHSDKSGRRIIILYAPDFDRDRLDSIIEDKIFRNGPLIKSIEKKSSLAILTEKERKMEADLPFGVAENAINVFLYTDLFEHIHFSWGEELEGYDFDAAFEELLKHRR